MGAEQPEQTDCSQSTVLVECQLTVNADFGGVSLRGAGPLRKLTVDVVGQLNVRLSRSRTNALDPQRLYKTRILLPQSGHRTNGIASRQLPRMPAARLATRCTEQRRSDSFSPCSVKEGVQQMSREPKA